MRVEQTAIAGVLKLTPMRYEDRRGSFAETWNQRAFAEFGIDADFVQDNCSASIHANTVRGLHLQIGDEAQDKLLQPMSGRIIDVIVDLRPDSETYCRWLTITLDAGAGEQVYVPRGLAHGFRTCAADTTVMYKVSSYYAPASERGIHWLDADLAIDWGVSPDDAVLSERDASLPSLRALLDELGQTMPAHIGPVQTDVSSVAQ